MKRSGETRLVCAVMAVWATALALAPVAWAEVRLPAIFGDNLVLQQTTEAPIWGWADANEKVTVSFGEQTVTATADAQGKWKTAVKTPSFGGPFTLKVAGKDSTIQRKNVLVGEVWVCSGQSNMEWSVRRATNPDEEIANAQYPEIRLFTVRKSVSDTPVDDCQGQWAECSPESVGDFSAVAYYFGRKLHKELGIPVGLINTSWGGTRAEAWTSAEGLAGEPDFQPILDRSKPFKPGNPHQGSVLYNGMLHPVVPFAIRGAIWYQGESNVGRAVQYARLFPAMIGDWRKQWGQGDFAFLFVQLAPFHYGNNGLLPELWDAQLKTLKTVENTGMAVTTDIGDFRDIHPKNKQDVGARLARWALADTYGKEVVKSGPIYTGMEVEHGAVRVRFDHAQGLKSRDGKPLTDFTIAGEDGEFAPATAEIDGETVLVKSDAVQDPVAVRCGWNNTVNPNLVNGEGLPASPFRTDDFDLKTKGQL